MRSIARLLVTTWLAACSGGTAASPHPAPRAPSEPATTAEAAISERECSELVTHAVKLGIDERGKQSGTTAADHEAVRRRLHDDFMADCRALSPGDLRCAMAATTLAELAGCHLPEAPQAMPSSSTSNSKVAPGGITPPAPRSP